MKKVSTVAAKPSRNISQQKLTIGLRTPNLYRAKRSLLESADGNMATAASGRKEKACRTKRNKNSLDSDRPSHGRRLHSRLDLLGEMAIFRCYLAECSL
jgi:hypothetical protein